MTTIASNIARDLPKLNQSELKELKKRIDALIQLEVEWDDHPKAIPDHDWLTDGIWSELARRGLVEKTFIVRRVRASSPKDYEARSAAIRKLILQHVNPPLPYPGLMALGQVCGEALARFIQHQEHFGLKSMLYSIDRVPEALEASFPGYLECGMIGFLIREKV